MDQFYIISTILATVFSKAIGLSLSTFYHNIPLSILCINIFNLSRPVFTSDSDDFRLRLYDANNIPSPLLFDIPNYVTTCNIKQERPMFNTLDCKRRLRLILSVVIVDDITILHRQLRTSFL